MKRNVNESAGSRSLLQGQSDESGGETENKENQDVEYSSIEDALHDLARLGRQQSSKDGTVYRSDTKGIIHSMTAQIMKQDEWGRGSGKWLSTRQCYFVTDGTIKFRHEGCDGRMPDTVFLYDRQKFYLNKKVLMFISASGSGKTVELAGSAATRGADLAIVVSMEDTEEIKDQSEFEKIETSLKMLKAKIEEVMEDTPALHTLVKLATPERPLTIIVAIDEASTCPNLVRSIIARQGDAWTRVNEALFGTRVNGLTDDQQAKIVVEFSVAGIGAYGGWLGSCPPNFTTFDTSARSCFPELCNHYLRNPTHIALPAEKQMGTQELTYEHIEKHLPVVATLMQNGQMASIAAKKLRELTDKNLKVVEAELVDAIVDSYLESNGMTSLIDDKSKGHMVAACAIAVHLFQWDKDNRGENTLGDEEDFQTFMSSLECGVKFDEDVEKVVRLGSLSAIQTIVHRYGLLESSLSSTKMERESYIYDLLTMSPPQQLVALRMLGMRGTDFVDAAPYGFESLTTHVMKCAIASSCVIQEESRPTLQHVLDRLGFEVHEKHGISDDVRRKWDNLSDYKVIPHSVTLPSRDKSFQNEYGWTKQMTVELNRVCNENSEGPLLQICKQSYDTLMSMNVPVEGRGGAAAADDDNVDDELSAFLPSALINYGSLPMADGFVTFFCKDSSSGGASNAFKYTLMNQARDHLKYGSRLHTEQMNELARRCDDVCLDGVFGEKEHRLMCVVAKSGKYFPPEEPFPLEQNFIVYRSDRCRILPKLLSLFQKNEKERIEQCAIICDSEGLEVDPQKP